MQLCNALEHCYKHEGEVMEALQIYAHYLHSGISALDIPSLRVDFEQIEKENKLSPEQSQTRKQDTIQANSRA